MIKLSQKDLKEKVDFAKKYMAGGNAAMGSEVDPNANISSKNVATLATEMNKDIDVQINRYALGERIEKMFGEEAKTEYYRQLESHEIYSHDESAIFNKPYCVAIDLYPFINGGNRMLGGSSDAPEHLHSFCGGYVNLIFLIAGQFAGAVADVSFLTYFDYFARKDYGEDYLKTNLKQIENFLQQVIYTLNDPAVGRGYQAVFYNTSIFDENYFKALFSSVIFPDFTNPKWETVEKLQEFFMAWFNKERNRALLTFPVMTAAYLTENGKAKDEKFKKFLAKEMSEGNSFFIYSSDSPDSLSSCCFEGKELLNVIHPIHGAEAVTIQDFVGKDNFSEYLIQSMNPASHKEELTAITGVLDKANDFEKLISIQIGDAVIKVTPDHVFHAKNKETGAFEEIPAATLLANFANYQLPVRIPYSEDRDDATGWQRILDALDAYSTLSAAVKSFAFKKIAGDFHG